jgi:hypothetical protein
MSGTAGSLSSSAAFGWRVLRPPPWPLPGDGSGTRVALLDSGLHVGQSTMTGVSVDAACSFVGADPLCDRVGHGTECASVLVAFPNGGAARGVARGVTLVIGQIIDPQGTGSVEALCSALEWSRSQEADVVVVPSGCMTPDSRLERCIQAIVTRAVVIAAVGNPFHEQRGALYPAAYPDVVGVGSLEHLAAYGAWAVPPDVIASMEGIHACGLAGEWRPARDTSHAAMVVAGFTCILISALRAGARGITEAGDGFPPALTAIANGVRSIGEEAWTFRYHEKNIYGCRCSVPSSDPVDAELAENQLLEAGDMTTQVHVQDASDHNAIEIDGLGARIAVGLSGQSGQVEVHDGQGALRAYLGCHLSGGLLGLLNLAGKHGVRLDGNDGLRVYNESGKLVLKFTGEANWIGTSEADGAAHAGLLVIRNAAGKDGIVLDGNFGFVVRDHAGKLVMNFAAEAGLPGKPAGLWIGTSDVDGAAHAGLLVIRNAAGKDGIILDGNFGFVVRDHAGKVVLNFAAEAGMASEPAGLWIGRAKNEGGGPGLLVLRDTEGNDAIVIDGAQGDIILANADCAEEFDVDPSQEVAPGSVVALNADGKLVATETPYDRRVVGVVSGAGSLRPGLVLDRRIGSTARLPVAIMGKVNCYVDAKVSPIGVGDLLTSSGTRGHAMKAEPGPDAYGALIGKALAPLRSGHGLMPILTALR